MASPLTENWEAAAPRAPILPQQMVSSIDAAEDEQFAIAVFAFEAFFYFLHLFLGAKTPVMKAGTLLCPVLLSHIYYSAPSFWLVSVPSLLVGTVIFFLIGDDFRSATGEWATISGALLVMAMVSAFSSDSPVEGSKTAVAVASCVAMVGTVAFLNSMELQRLRANECVRSWQQIPQVCDEHGSFSFHPPLVVFEVSKLVQSLRFGPKWWLRELTGANAKTRKQLYGLIQQATKEDLEYWLCKAAAPEVMFFLRPGELIAAFGATNIHRIRSLHPLAKAALIDAFAKSGRLRNDEVRRWTAQLICTTGRDEGRPLLHLHGGLLRHPRGGAVTVLNEGIVLSDPHAGLDAAVEECRQLKQRKFLTEQALDQMWTWRRHDRQRLMQELEEIAAQLAERTEMVEQLETANAAKAECLSRFKAALDGGGTVHTLHELVFARFDEAQRSEVLRHFRIQGDLMPAEYRGRKVLSDIDDTVICSGGHWPAGTDRRLHKGALYPGALSFLCEISGAGGGSSGSTVAEDTNGGANGVVFLSARPHLYKDYMEMESYRMFRSLLDAGLLGSMATLLPGKVLPPLKDAWRWLTRREGRWTQVGAQKAETLRQYAQLYPECSLVLVGDDGQGDRHAAEALLGSLPQLEAVFLHRILPEDLVRRRYGTGTPENVYFFRTYIGAAMQALEAKLACFGAASARRVAESAVAELLTMRMLHPRTTYQVFIDEARRDLRMLNDTLRRLGEATVDEGKLGEEAG